MAIKEALINAYRIHDTHMYDMYDIDLFDDFSSDRMPSSPHMKHSIMEIENAILKCQQPPTTFWIRMLLGLSIHQ